MMAAPGVPEPERRAEPSVKDFHIPKIRLFCFPYSGGAASAYRDWQRSLPAEFDVRPVQLPGREDRLLEDPISDLDRLLESLATSLRPALTAPFAFFGHSMGAVISWELARLLRHRYWATPVHMFVSGCPALPYVRHRNYADLPDAELTAHLRALGGTPEEVLRDSEMMQLVLPSIRADFTLLSNYKYQPGELLDCPVTVFAGDRDLSCPIESLYEWSKLTSADFRVRILSGGHFFLREVKDDLLSEIIASIGESFRRDRLAYG
jgi:medium-chain acyl-[acyl-carrier-protein] hydrolase